MNRLYQYILHGEGLGIKFLLILPLVFAIFFASMAKIKGVDLIPYAQDIADQMLPIKVENGEVVEPRNTIKTAKLHFNEHTESINLPIVIDTRIDTLDVSHLKGGIYLTQKNLYTVNAQKREIKILPLENSFELPKADYSDLFLSALNWGVFCIFVFSFILMFFFCFMLSLFFSFCLQIINPILRLAAKAPILSNLNYSEKWINLDFDQRMRLTSLCFVFICIIKILLYFTHINLSNTILALIMLLIQTSFLYILPLKNQ